MRFCNFLQNNSKGTWERLFFIINGLTMLWTLPAFVVLNSNETPFLRTKVRLRQLPVSLRHLGRAGSGRNAGGHFQRGFPAVVAQSRPLLSLPAGAREPRQVQAVVREPPPF